METIALAVKSPNVATPGLDHLIERLERADALVDKLRAHAAAPVRIRFAVSGEEHLQVASTNLESLAAAFKSVGEFRIGDGLSKGLITPGEAAKASAKELEKLKLRFKELNETAVAATGKFQSQSAYSAPDLEKLAARRKAIEGIIGERNAVQTRIEGLERASGMASAMSGGAQAIQATTAAERALAPASQSAARALEEQDAIVRHKIAAMQGLTKATKGSAEAEREQADAATQSGRANQQSALLSERIVRDQKGEELDRIRKLRTGPGQTLTTSNAGSVEASDMVQAHRRAFEEIDSEFAGRKAMLAGAGFEKGSPEQIALLREEAVARGQRVAAMQAEGLGAEGLAEKQRTLAAGLEATAHATEQRNLRQAQSAAESSSQSNLNAGLRDQIALIDRQYEATRSAARGELELAQATRQRAQEYRATVADVRAAEQMSGLNSDPGRESYLRGLETRAARLEADATRTETRLANVARANAQAAQDFERQFAAFGGKDKKTSEQRDAGGRTVRQVAVKDDALGGVREQIELVRRFDAAGKELEPTLTRTTSAMAENRRGLTALGASFVHNVASVATWSAAVGALYGTLSLLSFGFESTLKFERQFATLQAVYRGTNEEALQLGMTSLKLGAAQGRSGDEANDAAVRWSRLGLMGEEAGEAIAVSLQAANVAEITAAESAEHLSAIYASYRLEVGELRTVLNELNTVSNTLNVTNKDLLQGIARTGAIAKQAGIPLAELIGMIGTGVSRTGRSGAEIGNAIKSIIVAVSNPELQNTLQSVFGFNVKTPIGELKDMSTIFDELYVKVQGLDNAARGELLQKIGGKQQASRLEALLDGYVTSQVKAIEAQQDLNSADREATLIRNTVISQMQSLTTEFQRLFYAMLSVGGEQSALGTLSNLISLATGLNGLLADSPWIGRLLGNAADVGGIGTTINTAASWLGTKKAPDESGIFNRQLEETKGLAGAAEMSERLATTLRKGIAITARRDPGAARQTIEEFASVTGNDAKERNLNREELLQLLEQNRMRELENRLQEIGEGFGRRRLELRTKESQIIAGDIARQEQVVASLQKQVSLKSASGEDTRAMERKLADARRELERLRGAGKENLLKNYGEGEGFDPLETVKKNLSDRTKIGLDAQATLFTGGIGETESAKLDRKMQALQAEEDAVDKLAAKKDAAFAVWPKDSGVHTAAVIAEQEQLNAAIDAEVASRRASIDAEREKVGILRETARIQDQITAGTRDAKNKILGTQIGQNDTQQNIAEVQGISGLAFAATDRGGAAAQGEAIAYGNRLLEIQASLAERRYRLERDITNARAAQNAEASKALQMASREDQLRAALLTRFTRDNGQISPEQFQFLDQETRQAAQKFVPDASTAVGGKAQELEAERDLLQKQFEGLNSVILATLENLRKAADPGLLLKGANGGAVAPPPQINLPAVNFNLGAQFEEAMKGLYAIAEGRVAAQMQGIQAQVNAFLGSQRINGAQAGGASSINS